MGIPGSGLVKPVVKPLQKGASFAARPLKPVVKPLKPLVKPLTKDKPKPVGAIPIFDHNHKALLGGTRANSDPRIHVPDDNFFKKYAAEDEDVIEEEIIEEEIIEEEIIEEEYFEEEPVASSVSTPPPNKNRPTTIKFDEFDDMFDVLHLNDYSKTEISKTWYERSDFSKMVEDSRKVVQKWEEDTQKGKDKDKENKDDKKKTSVLKDLKYDPRGLENWTTMGATKVKLIKETAMDAVWNEQMRQWNRHRMNPEQIRLEYQRTTRGSETAARKLAEADREFVDAMLEEEAARREYERNMKKRQKILRQGKKIVGGTVKGSTKLTGTVLKKTGKGVITTGKITGKSSLAIATLDRKALMKAIKNKKDEKGCVEGVHHRRASLSSRNLLASLEGIEDPDDTPVRKGHNPQSAPSPAVSPGGRPSLLNPHHPVSPNKTNSQSPQHPVAPSPTNENRPHNYASTRRGDVSNKASVLSPSSAKPLAQSSSPPRNGPTVEQSQATPEKIHSDSYHDNDDNDHQSVDSVVSGISGASGDAAGSTSGTLNKRQKWKERRKEKRQRRKEKKQEKKEKKREKKDRKKLEKKEKHSHRPEWEAPNLVKSGKY
jgi:hypothetical protein